MFFVGREEKYEYFMVEKSALPVGGTLYRDVRKSKELIRLHIEDMQCECG